MEITWDDRKEAANINKHGIDFGEAATVIHNPLSLYNLNKHKAESGLSIWATLIGAEYSM